MKICQGLLQIFQILAIYVYLCRKSFWKHLLVARRATLFAFGIGMQNILSQTKSVLYASDMLASLQMIVIVIVYNRFHNSIPMQTTFCLLERKVPKRTEVLFISYVGIPNNAY